MSDPGVLYFQRLLAAAGLYRGPLDGIDGWQTKEAELTLEQANRELAGLYGSFDVRTEEAIALTLPATQRLARIFLVKARAAGFDARILSGTRTYTEQDDLYARGRTTPGAVVTRAKGGESSHNFGLAFDIGLFDRSGRYLQEAAPYRDVAKLRPSGLAWGGDWKSFPDAPHYELERQIDLATVRERFERGTPLALGGLLSSSSTPDGGPTS